MTTKTSRASGVSIATITGPRGQVLVSLTDREAAERLQESLNTKLQGHTLTFHSVDDVGAAVQLGTASLDNLLSMNGATGEGGSPITIKAGDGGVWLLPLRSDPLWVSNEQAGAVAAAASLHDGLDAKGILMMAREWCRREEAGAVSEHEAATAISGTIIAATAI